MTCRTVIGSCPTPQAQRTALEICHRMRMQSRSENNEICVRPDRSVSMRAKNTLPVQYLISSQGAYRCVGPTAALPGPRRKRCRRRLRCQSRCACRRWARQSRRRCPRCCCRCCSCGSSGRWRAECRLRPGRPRQLLLCVPEGGADSGRAPRHPRHLLSFRNHLPSQLHRMKLRL